MSCKRRPFFLAFLAAVMSLYDAILVIRLFAVFKLVHIAAAVSDEKLSLVFRQPDSEEVQKLKMPLKIHETPTFAAQNVQRE